MDQGLFAAMSDLAGAPVSYGAAPTMNAAMWRTNGWDTQRKGQEVPDTKRLLLVWAPLVAVVTVMCAVCLLFNAPPSPLRSALAQRADAVFGSWYGQSWNLFGPQVPEGTWQVGLRVRLAHRKGQPDTREWNLTEEVNSSGGTRLLHQSKEGHMLNCFGEYALGVRPGTDPGEDTSLRMLRTKCRDDYVTPEARAPSAPWWDRYFSAHARQLVREQAGDRRPIEAVRVRMRVQPVPPFQERDAPPEARKPPVLVHDTDWRPYVPVEAR